MSKSEIRHRQEQIKSRFTTGELTAIEHRRGAYSRAAWLRNAALISLALPPERPDRAGIPPNDIAAVAELSGNLGRCAGATIQLAKALRETRQDGFHTLAERILADLRRHEAALATLIARLK